MKRQALVICGLVLLVGFTPAFAQSSATARFDIPFEFVIGDITLPAGDYTVNYEVKTALLQIGKTGKSVSAIVLTGPTQSKEAADGTRLLFNRHGAKYFLSQMWVSGNDRGCEVHKTNYEREVMAQGLKTKTIQVAAK